MRCGKSDDGTELLLTYADTMSAASSMNSEDEAELDILREAFLTIFLLLERFQIVQTNYTTEACNPQ